MTVTTATPAKTSSRPHFEPVDGMRALAALIVLVNHAYAQVFGDGEHAQPGFVGVFWWSLVVGHLAVTVFIVISGFCLMLPVIENGGTLRGGFKSFITRRARRILPPYYAAVLLCLALIATVIGKPTGTLWDVPIRADLTSVVAHFLLIQDFVATSHINYVFWSIAVEWQIYLLMPLLVWAWRRFGSAPVVIGALIVGYGLRFGFEDTRLVRAHPHFLGMFAIGMLAAELARSEAPRIVKFRTAVPWGTLCVAAIVAVGVMAKLKYFKWIDLPVALLGFAALLGSTTAKGGPLKSFLSFHPLVTIGTFSYSLYLIHAPLLQILWQYVLEPFGVDPTLRFYFLMTIGVGLVLALSYLFFLAVEAPFLGSARKPRVVAATSAPTP
jgi:peptidoglycan/LPS O-acetylase OafA/YrhL